ncbi:MAG: Hpt domain-containing protein [Lachnospiraceae bacterium]|nr:Hpt domain-containing protein [Lachnospiraceae bacterium]
MLSIETLDNFGAKTSEGLKRCFGNEEFYLKLVSVLPDEPNFDDLKDALAKNDLKAAFEYAHALKGVAANLSMTPLSRPVEEITEHLREMEEMDYSPLLAEIMEKREELRALINE